MKEGGVMKHRGLYYQDPTDDPLFGLKEEAEEEQEFTDLKQAIRSTMRTLEEMQKKYIRLTGRRFVG